MIKGIGIDIIELDRIKKSMRKYKRFIDRILTNNEQEVLHRLPHERRRIEYLAGRFAAKEAFAKATGYGIGRLSFKHIEVLNDKNNAPFIMAKGYEENKIWISITHSRDYAVAQAIIEVNN